MAPEKVKTLLALRLRFIEYDRVKRGLESHVGPVCALVWWLMLIVEHLRRPLSKSLSGARWDQPIP